MRRLSVLLLVVCGAARAAGEPPWGANCLACHGQWQPNYLSVVGYDLLADPDESATGAPDRGTLKVFRGFRGTTETLAVSLSGLIEGDTYAVELRRLRFPGVEHGGTLAYGADCAWPEWGENASYYTQPAVGYRWGSGPAVLEYELAVEPEADLDYYDVVLAVAGQFEGDGTLFYVEEHVYVQVFGEPGDLNCDGVLDFEDINPFVLALTNPAAYAGQYPACHAVLADCDGDRQVGFGDINAFVALLSG